MRRLLALAFALSLGLYAWTAAAATDPAGYRAALLEARGLLDREDLAPEERASRAVARLAQVDAVQLPDGSALRPARAWLLAPLEERPPDLAAARARLDALATELARAERLPAAPADADAKLRRVLERAEFAPPRPNPLAEWLGGALAPLVEWLRGWLPDVDLEAPTRPDAGDSRLPLALVALVIALGVAAVVALGLRRAVARPVVAVPVTAARAATWEETLAEAARLAAAGQYRLAIRALYVATLLRGEALGQIRFDRALTNRELVASARASGGPALAERVGALVERFDRIWYGGAAGSSREYDELSRLAAGLWATA